MPGGFSGFETGDGERDNLSAELEYMDALIAAQEAANYNPDLAGSTEPDALETYDGVPVEDPFSYRSPDDPMDAPLPHPREPIAGITHPARYRDENDLEAASRYDKNAEDGPINEL